MTVGLNPVKISTDCKQNNSQAISEIVNALTNSITEKRFPARIIRSFPARINEAIQTKQEHKKFQQLHHQKELKPSTQNHICSR